MATPRPTTRTGEHLLPSKSKAALSRRNSLESARQQPQSLRPRSSSAQFRAEQELRKKVATLKEDLRKADLEYENLSTEKQKLLRQLQTRSSNRETIQGRVSELKEGNDSLRREVKRSEQRVSELKGENDSLRGEVKRSEKRVSELQRENDSLSREVKHSKGLREDLGQQLLSVRKDEASIWQEKKTAVQENDRLRKENTSLRQERESILQGNERIFQENCSLCNRLNSLEPEADTLRKENARLVRENALLKQESLEHEKTFTEERVALQKEVERLKRDNDQDQLYLQKIKAVEQNAEGLVQEVERLHQTLDGETEKLKETQQRERDLQSQLNKLKDSSHPCPKTKCLETRAERDKLARDIKKKCARPECVSVKAELESVKNRIMQMERKQCNSRACQNQQLKDMNDTVGSKIRMGDRECSHSEALQLLVQREGMQHAAPSEEVESLKSRLQKMYEEKQHLQQQLDTANGRQHAAPSKEVESLKSRLQKMYEEKQHLQQQLDTANGRQHAAPSKEVESLKSRLQKMYEEKQHLQQQLDTANGRQHAAPSKEVESLKSRLQKMYEEKQHLQQQLDTANGRQHAAPSKEVESLKSRLQKMYEEKQHLQQQLDTANGRQHTAPSEEVKSLKSHLQKMHEEKQHLQQQLDTASGRNATGRCTRSDCQRIQEQLKRMQSEHSQGRSAAKDMTIMSGGEYDEPLEEFNEVFTNPDPDELLGVLESCLEPFEAKKVLCKIFQCAYGLCKTAALQRIKQTLEQLFTVSEDRSQKEVLGEISRAYGLLLHVSGLKSDEAICRDICLKIVAELTNDEAYNKAGRALQAKQEYLLKGVQVAWKFVTLPSPIIASQPETYIPQSVEREYGYWDDSTPDAPLIYTRPVVYRCYDGNRAEKGMVANTETCNIPEGPKKGFIRKAIDYVLQREQ